jgi:hypothetical protein
MGGLSGMLGLGGGVSGTGMSGPEQARIDDGATLDQAKQLYGSNIQALGMQDYFTNQILNQNGLGNQSNVFNQLQNVANGTGPNPAQAMLNQATGANVANQAALMAGQRGSNANVGLIGRQAAMQGANTQQQAAGQAATMQANQSMNALGAMGNLATQQANQAVNSVQANTQAQQAEQSNILNSINQQNAARAGVQSSINSANASMANTKMGQQGNMIGNIMGGVGSVLSLAQGGQVPRQAYAEGSAVVPGSGQYAPMDVNQPDPFAQVAPAPAANPQAAPSQKGPRSAIGKMFAAPSPQQPQQDGMAQAGQAIGKMIGTGLKSIFAPSAPAAPKSGYDAYSASGFTPEQMSNDASRQDAVNAGGLLAPSELDNQYGQQNQQQMMPANNVGMPMAAQGGKVPAMVSPGEVYLDREAVKEVEKGKNPIKAGEKIPGKAKVKGNSYANDTVPKTLEAGGIVLPKSVMEAKHPHWEAHKFVSAIMAKQGKLPSKKSK